MAGFVSRVTRRTIGLLLRRLGRRRLAATSAVGREVVRQWEQWPDAKAAQHEMLEFGNEFYAALGRVATRAEGGRHPKHRLIDYHRFFIDHIRDGESVLDVGCHAGALTRDLATATSGPVVGIESNPDRFHEAETEHGPSNLRYVLADATAWEAGRPFDVIVLSNVLEHIVDRVGFLHALVTSCGPKRVLVRVPMFERDWTVPLKRELGIESRLDSTHRIEHTERELRDEMEKAGLRIDELRVRFGEFLVVCIPEAA